MDHVALPLSLGIKMIKIMTSFSLKKNSLSFFSYISFLHATTRSRREKSHSVALRWRTCWMHVSIRASAWLRTSLCSACQCNFTAAFAGDPWWTPGKEKKEKSEICRLTRLSMRPWERSGCVCGSFPSPPNWIVRARLRFHTDLDDIIKKVVQFSL